MRQGQIYQFLKTINIFSWDDREEWVNCSCPFALYTHSNGVDNNPSFGIRVNVKGKSVYKCWSCGQVGTLDDLLMKLQYYEKLHDTKNPYHWKLAWQMVQQEEDDAESFIFEGAEYKECDEVQESLVEFPPNWLYSFMPITEHPYLTERQVSKGLLDKYKLVYDVTLGRVCFPIYDFDGVLRGLQGRAVAKNAKLRYKFYKYQGKMNPNVWLGEFQCDVNQIVILCEGFFDLFRIAAVYPNVIASMTSSLTNEKMDRLKEVSQIISFYDYGTGGNFARKKLDKYFGGGDTLLGHCIPTEVEDDPGNMTPERIAEELRNVCPSIVLNKGF